MLAIADAVEFADFIVSGFPGPEFATGVFFAFLLAHPARGDVLEPAEDVHLRYGQGVQAVGSRAAGAQ